MPKLKSISIENYRSIGNDTLTIHFKENTPTILIGENNSGKSNILRAIDILFGEWHPKSKEFDDHDYFGRNPNESLKIKISAKVQSFSRKLGRNQEYTCGGFGLEAMKVQANQYYAIEAETGQPNQYVSNELRNELSCVLVNSEQNLSYQLSYSSKYTLLSRVTRAFHDKLVSDQERVNRLKSLFSNIVSTFNEVEEFIDFKKNMSSIAGEMISNMSHGLDLDFSAYDPSNYFKSLKVNPKEGEEFRAFEEIGSGQQQILALSFAHAYAKSFKGQGLILLLDEPEAHLHPLAQKWLSRTLFDMAKDGLQVVITTHSPFFINLEYLEGIYIIQKDVHGTIGNSFDTNGFTQYCTRTGSDANRTNSRTIVPFYASHAIDNILKGFFSKKIILVEGPTEELALPIYFKKIGLDTLKEGIDIISVGGKGNLAKWWRLFTYFKIPVFLCFDNDQENDSQGKKRKEALKAIGIQDNLINEVLTSDSWNINEKFCVFGKDFETTMRTTFESYQALESVEKERLGNSKPIIAKEVAKKLEYNEESTEWENIKKISQKIQQLSMNN